MRVKISSEIVPFQCLLKIENKIHSGQLNHRIIEPQSIYVNGEKKCEKENKQDGKKVKIRRKGE